MNMVFIGYRGTGKSTIARIVSRRLHRRLCSIDLMVIRSAGKTISQIVEEEGWKKFREMESEQIRIVTDEFKNVIIDCGGGAVLNPENIQQLKMEGRIVCLTAETDEIIRRIRQDRNRPSLKEVLSFEEEQRQVLAEREPLYNATADFIFDTTSAGTEETASQVIRYFRNRRWI